MNKEVKQEIIKNIKKKIDRIKLEIESFEEKVKEGDYSTVFKITLILNSINMELNLRKDISPEDMEEIIYYLGKETSEISNNLNKSMQKTEMKLKSMGITDEDLERLKLEKIRFN